MPDRWPPDQLPGQSNGPQTAEAAVTRFVTLGTVAAPPSAVSSAQVSHEAWSPVPEQVGPHPDAVAGGVQF